ncbi:MAG: ATP-dependent DNA helicase [Candidatus Woesearchaeota archaeon]|nr:ATP-dependent DNA helicase [Candidatus Woesearchaeota archaeon]
MKDLLFPYDAVRDVQKEMLSLVDDAIMNGKKLIVHAPTGLGKTAAVLAPALKNSIKNDLTVFFLTSRHTQHQIAIKTLKEIKEKYDLKFTVADIIGKKWMCSFPEVENLGSNDFADYCKSMRKDDKCEFYVNTKKAKLSVEAKQAIDQLENDSPCSSERIIELCRNRKLCPYEIAIELAKNSKVIITDYNYIFNPKIQDSFFAKTGKEIGKSVIIIDEGHNLPSRMRELMTSIISSFTIKRAIQEAKKNNKDIIPKLSQIQDVLNDLAEDLETDHEKLVEKEEFIDKTKKFADYDELTAELELIGTEIRENEKKSFIGSVANFLESWHGDDEGFTRILENKNTKFGPSIALTYRCLDPSLTTRPVIANSHSTIMMSGTLTPTSMYADLLGFPKGTVEASLKSPFPEKNKLMLVVPQTTTKFTKRNEEQYRKIAAICADIANNVPGNSIIFFPSYELMKNVNLFFKDLCRITTFIEDRKFNKKEKIEFLEKFKSYKNKGGATLLAVIGANFAEGIDLPDLLKAVVIVGLPLQKPSLEIKELMKYYEEKFGKGVDYGYILPALQKILQAAGRCIRSETDKGVIVFLEERYILPTYFRCFENETNLKVTNEYMEEIKKFFSL